MLNNDNKKESYFVERPFLTDMQALGAFQKHTYMHLKQTSHLRAFTHEHNIHSLVQEEDREEGVGGGGGR